MVVFLSFVIMRASREIGGDGCVSWEGSRQSWEL